MIRQWMSGRRGSEIVEAALVIPVIAGVTLILLSLFVFYLKIMSTGVQEHREALKVWDDHETAVVEVYERSRTVAMFDGAGTGWLSKLPHKDIETKAYLFNEDRVVRAEKVIHEK